MQNKILNAKKRIKKIFTYLARTVAVVVGMLLGAILNSILILLLGTEPLSLLPLSDLLWTLSPGGILGCLIGWRYPNFILFFVTFIIIDFN